MPQGSISKKSLSNLERATSPPISHSTEQQCHKVPTGYTKIQIGSGTGFDAVGLVARRASGL